MTQARSTVRVSVRGFDFRSKIRKTVDKWIHYLVDPKTPYEGAILTYCMIITWVLKMHFIWHIISPDRIW